MAEAKVIIKSENNISKGLNSAKKDLSGFEQYAAGIGDKLKSAFTATAILVAVKKITDGLASCFKAFNEADRAYKRLSLSLSDTKGFNSVKQSIADLSKITLSSKGDVEAMVSELAALGKSSEEINAISEAAVHLSNVTGKDLNSSMTTLLNTYRGTTTQLNRLGIDTSNLTKEELAQGAAVDLVTTKFGELSKAMAADDSTQTIKNIKDNLGDIGQSIGQIVNVSLAPLLKNIETVTNWAKDKVQDVADTITVFIQGFPVIWQHLLAALKATLDNFWKSISSVDGIKTLIDGIIQIVVKRIQLIGNAIANIWDMAIKVGESALKGIGNLAMSWIVGITDSMGVNFSDIINSIGKWLLESPIGKFVDAVISKAINGVKLVGTIIKNIPQIVKIVIQNIGDLISEFFTALPEYLKNVFKGIGNWILYGIQKIKNDFLQTIQDAINSLGETISDSWVGKAMKWMGLDLGGKLESIDFGIDTTKQDSYKATADSYFGAAHGAMSGVREIGAEMGKQISELLSPQIEKWEAKAGESIGQKLATWTAKSSDEYLDAAKDNFKDIGSFLKDWGKTFLGDLGDDWDALQKTMGDVFENTFGGDMSSFIDWFKEYIKTLKAERAAQGLPTLVKGNGNGDGDDDDDDGNGSKTQKKKDKSVNFLIKNGAFGSHIGKIAEGIQSRANDGTLSLWTAFGEVIKELLPYLQKGLQVVGNIFDKAFDILGNAVAILGERIGKTLLPLLEAFIPFMKTIADIIIALSPVVESILAPAIKIIAVILNVLTGVLDKLMPVFAGLASVIQWVSDAISYAIGSVINWLASWIPWISTTEVKNPKSIGDYYWDIMNSYDASKNGTIDSSMLASAQASAQNASYAGGNSVTINIYQEAPVVGEGGMLEFAQMIRSQFEALDYYSV